MVHASRILGRYAVELRLGESARGYSLAVRDVESNELRVVKVLPGISDPRGVARLRATLERARRAAAPALVRTIEVGLSTELEAACVVSEHVAGDVVVAPVEAPVAAEIARQIAASLRALHAIGLAHGALHARNVLVDTGGRVRLRDYALAPGSAADDVRALGELVRSWIAEDDDSTTAHALRGIVRTCLEGAPIAQVEAALQSIARGSSSRPSRPTATLRTPDTLPKPGASLATLVVKCKLPASLRARSAGEQRWLADALGERARITLVDEEIVGFLETDFERAQQIAAQVRLSWRARCPDAVVSSVIREVAMRPYTSAR